MRWEEVKERFPHQWLLIEVTEARSEGGERIVDAVSVVDTFPTSTDAWRAYAIARRQAPDREFIPLHTDYGELRFEERPGIGFRWRA